MQSSRRPPENQAMHGIGVAVLSEDREQLNVLQSRIDSTNLGRTVYTHLGFPLSATDPVVRQIQDLRAEVVLVDINPENQHSAIAAIELLHATTSDITIFAAGQMSDPATIVATMRAGAREFIDRNASREALIECLTRHAATRSKNRGRVGKAKVFAIVNAKGGSGATTLAVNIATALQEHHGKTVLVDMAPIGHAALHLNVRPSFGVADALQNLHRMDGSLLDGLMTNYKNGLHLLAGPQQPYNSAPSAADLAHLFDLLVGQYNFVVIDCSGRLDATTRLICELSNAVLLVTQADVVSLWSAGRVQTYLEEAVGQDRLRLVLNRYKKIPGFGDDDVEKATNSKLLWRIPNNYQFVGPAIDRGTPPALQDNQEVSRSFAALASTLAEASAAEGGLNLVYLHDKSDSKKKAPGRLLITPVRAGQ